jgi:transcriptional regulator with XRE-family HTH domain
MVAWAFVSTVKASFHERNVGGPVAVTLSIRELGAALRARRAEQDLSLKDVEETINVSAATLSRIERGHSPDTTVIGKLAEWLGVNVTTAGEQASTIRTDADLKNQIAVHLRANKRLSAEVANAIAQSFEAIMQHEIRKAKKTGEDAANIPNAPSHSPPR